jgi:O6-methylguanine-DNA--protein-cysteine methyltransferase
MDKLKQMQRLLLRIPKGKVTSYKEIARKLRVHPRVAGRLVGSNPDGRKYPCYKVVHTDGRLGGYTSSEGVKEKVKRLKKDGIEINNGRISKKFFFHF